MPDPLPTPLPDGLSYSPKFADCVRKYTNDIYALSFLLLEHSAEAEKVTFRTFVDLHKIYKQDNFNAEFFSLDAYRSCIQQCSDRILRRNLLSAKSLPWEEQLVKVMWYGMKLPLPTISIILQRSVPVLKMQLRHVREQMTATVDILPSANLSIV